MLRRGIYNLIIIFFKRKKKLSLANLLFLWIWSLDLNRFCETEFSFDKIMQSSCETIYLTNRLLSNYTHVLGKQY